MKRENLVAVAPLALFGLLVLVLVMGLHYGQNQSGKFVQHIGDPAPKTDLPVLDGGGARFKTSAWRGRPYVVNFFASWCPDCRQEHEELMTLAASNIPMIGITFKDKPAKISAYIDKNGNPFAAIAQDDEGRAATGWGLVGVPETFVVDARGIIRWHHVGGLTDQLVTDELMPVWENIEHGSNPG